ncbi:hypothetical protein Taro_046734 [Colocasia esculenta]|uniref:Phospholipase D n=1 Tax=Colocasia esculenta TaxID=4460 RepID=A0A843WZG6_COLES|nr:hypothetical protein [Colocasia esculenta]
MAEEEAPQFLHGVLDATIFQAKHLHRSQMIDSILKVTEKIGKALHLRELTQTRVYATLDIGAARVARTRLIGFGTQNPRWEDSFRIYCCYTSSTLVVSVKDEFPVAAAVLGCAKVPISRLLTGEPVERWLDLFDGDGQKLPNAKIQVRFKFSHVASDPGWNAGIRLSDFSGVPSTHFPHRTGGGVTLYQNSHLSDGFCPVIPLAGGGDYRPPRLWEDIYHAILEAKHFIYVVGWSVNVKITLVRDPERMIPGAEGVTIGELLKRKAEEGVTVLVMVWQDRTSLALLGNAGLMKTHDLETHEFFEKTKVRCFLCPRNADHTLSVVEQIETAAEFTHHQKTITLDAPIDGSGEGGGDDGDSSAPRRIVSFVGGVDLCDGRYDDENHTLFRNLDTTYHDDFQQNNFPNADLCHGGPREPWHDIHSKLEGPAALDVLCNFEQRWKKQAPSHLSDCLMKIQDYPELFPAPRKEGDPDDGESWNVQVFRSIDDASVVGFPSDPREASRMGLVSGKDVVVEQSIHSGYVEAIRRATRFIYIENQYFFGSCASWKADQDSECLNLVPIEMAAKIVRKIQEGERFAVYVVTPMWPEGEPESDTVQAILHWNRLTMEMMYEMVTKAIDEAGLRGRAHPCDYLNFFCLGNREVEQPGEYVSPEQPEPETNYWRAQVNRRFLIYVHSKLMIVDHRALRNALGSPICAGLRSESPTAKIMGHLKVDLYLTEPGVGHSLDDKGSLRMANEECCAPRPRPASPLRELSGETLKSIGGQEV